MTERRSRAVVSALLSRRDPNFRAIGVRVERPVIEVHSQNAELPHLVSDVLTGIGDRAVRANEDLVCLVLIRTRVRFERHYPAARMFSFGLKMDNAELLHMLERLVPEMQMKDL